MYRKYSHNNCDGTAKKKSHEKREHILATGIYSSQVRYMSYFLPNQQKTILCGSNKEKIVIINDINAVPAVNHNVLE